MPDRKRVPGPTTHTRLGSATGAADCQSGFRYAPGNRCVERWDIAEEVTGASADDEPVAGLLDLYLAFLDDDADRVWQAPDTARDVCGCGGSGATGPRFVLHPDLVRADAHAVLVSLHEVDVQALRVIEPETQFLVIAQCGAHSFDVDSVKVLAIV